VNTDVSEEHFATLFRVEEDNGLLQRVIFYYQITRRHIQRLQNRSVRNQSYGSQNMTQRVVWVFADPSSGETV
jgi:hypothetical protein